MKELKNLIENLTERAEEVLITVTDKGGEAINKTVESVTDKVTLAEKKAELQLLYENLGEKVYDKYAGSGVSFPQFTPIFSSIEATIDTIEELEENISKRKGVRICEICGAVIAREFAFCPDCGTEQPDDYDDDLDDDDGGSKCPFCKSDIKPTDKFCHHCGRKI